jgi:hypothetical protein
MGIGSSRRWTRAAASVLSLLSLLSLLAFLLMLPASAQAQAIDCDRSLHDPNVPDEGRIMERYYVATAGVGGLGCWVHPHANGRDFVITPRGWGRRPNAARRVYLDATMESISAARAAYEPLGDMDVDLFFMLNDADRRGQIAYWLVGDQCWMEGAATGTVMANFRQVVAHEIGHCLLMKEQFWTLGSYVESVHQWLDESGAEFLSSEVYPATNVEYSDGSRYVLDFPLQQPYRAHVLLREYANRHGVPATLTLLRDLATASSRDVQMAMLRAKDYTPEFLETLVMHLNSQIADPGGGTIPNRSTGLVHPSITLSDASETAALPPLDGMLLNMVELTVASGFDLRLQPIEGGSHPVQALIDRGTDGPPQPIGSAATFLGQCDAELSVPLRLAHLHPTPSTGAVVRYRMTARDCDAPEPVASGSGIVGTWRARNASVRGMFAQVYGNAMPIRGVSGDVLLTLTESGTATLQYRDVHIVFDQSRAPIPEIVVSGGGELGWRRGSPGELVFDGRSFSLQAKAAGMTIPMDSSGFPMAPTRVRFGLVDTELVFTRFDGLVFFPRVWVKQ